MEKLRTKDGSLAVERCCPVCKVEFLTYKKSPATYCSRKCAHVKQTKKRETKCNNCGVVFTIQNWRISKKEHNYCTYDCYCDYLNQRKPEDGKGTQAECLYCSKEFVRKNTSQKYCSTKCCGFSRKKYFDIPEYLDCADRKIDKNLGYVRVYVGKDYPGASSRGYAYEHRVIMQEKLGRILLKDEHVHHKNHCRWDNCLENLEVMSASEHGKLTQLELAEGYEIVA